MLLIKLHAPHLIHVDLVIHRFELIALQLGIRGDIGQRDIGILTYVLPLEWGAACLSWLPDLLLTLLKLFLVYLILPDVPLYLDMVLKLVDILLESMDFFKEF